MSVLLLDLNYLKIKIVTKDYFKHKDKSKGPWIGVPKRVLRMAYRRNYLKRLIRHTLRLAGTESSNRIGLITVKECNWEIIRSEKGYRTIRRIQLYLWRDLNPHP